MEFPGASENIFPTSKENLQALLDHYFPKISEEEKSRSFAIWYRKDEEDLHAMNQLEYGARICQENKMLLDLRGFSTVPAARIHFVLIFFFYSPNDWRKFATISHRKRLLELKRLLESQPNLLNRIEGGISWRNIYPKTENNITALVNFYFPEEENKEFVEYSMGSKRPMGHLHYAAHFCAQNKLFLDREGISSSPAERIEVVIKSLFTPSYLNYGADWNKNHDFYENIKGKFFEECGSINREQLNNYN